MSIRGGFIVVVLSLCAAQAAWSATVAQRCESGKLTVAAKYSACRLKAEAKAVKKGTAADFSKCDSKFAAKWAVYEDGDCPLIGDLAAQQRDLSADTRRTAWQLSGEARFVDNADGTIMDRRTGLIWEKKTELDFFFPSLTNPHDADNRYMWAGTCSGLVSKHCQPTTAASALCAAHADGDTGCVQCTGGEGVCSATATVWTWVSDLNSATFAGHSDWRLPTLFELQAIVDYADPVGAPAVDVAFHGPSCGATCTDINSAACSCTPGSGNWSASERATTPSDAWVVYFQDGSPVAAFQHATYFVRAVREGF
ncbi:MAG: DUF1566 domain-containing protein [Candidatus Binatia bacterium]